MNLGHQIVDTLLTRRHLMTWSRGARIYKQPVPAEARVCEDKCMLPARDRDLLHIIDQALADRTRAMAAHG